MKPVVIPLVEQLTLDCSYFSPLYKFDSEWTLELHGFLDRQEFKDLIDRINYHIRDHPLMSKRMQSLLMRSFGAAVVVMVFLTFFLAASSGIFIAPTIINLLIAIGYFVARKVVENMAAKRAEKFSKHLNSLFKEFNGIHNPTANWKLTWRTVIDSYNVSSRTTIDGNVEGKITPNYAEQAEITLEIHDSLSDLTTYTISLMSKSTRTKEIMSSPQKNTVMSNSQNNLVMSSPYTRNNYTYNDPLHTNNIDKYNV